MVFLHRQRLTKRAGIRKRLALRSTIIASPRLGARAWVAEPLENRLMLATTWHVDASVSAPAPDGVGWASACADLQMALGQAAAGDTIKVADGTYTPTTTTDRTVSFQLKTGVSIRGGYAGHGAADPDARDTALYPSILSGDIGAIGDSADNSFHVVVGATAILDGFTITAGNADGSFPDNAGGGMYNSSYFPTLTNCTFTGNTATYGGGIYNHQSAPKLTNCTFTGNSASHGGGMYNNFNSLASFYPTLTDCTFTENSASDRIGAYGGGIYNDYASPTLTNCTFTRNTASDEYSASGGGGMWNSSSSRPTLINCTFSGNEGSLGGGMGNYGSSPTLTNCTFTWNTARYGGGMYDRDSSPMLTNCTFTENSATDGNGSGMYNDFSSPTLTNCVLWGSGSSIIYNASGTPTITYSIIRGGYAGTGNMDADPLFVRSPWTGPDGVFGTADDDYGDLRLQPTSPCIDRGNNNAPGLAGITTDVAGAPRFVDIPIVSDAGVGTPPVIDIGAYETQWWCPPWLAPIGATWDAGTYSLDIGMSVLTIPADDSNRSERLTAIRQFIASGRSGGAGIVSTTATEDQGIITALAPAGNILIRLARIGDVTLDDQLDGDDYFALDQAFLAAGDSFQPAADVNVDGTIDARDYFLLDAAFLRSSPATPQSPPQSPAPQQPPPTVFSTHPIAEDLLIEDQTVLA